MTNNVVEAVVHIEGTRPLFWHAFTPEAIPLEKKEKTGVAGNDPVEWQRIFLVVADTRLLYIPGTYAFSCINEGGKYIKKGRISYQPIIIATLLVLDDAIFIDDRRLPEQPTTDPDQPVYLDIRGVRNPSTRGMNVRYRIACRSGWTCAFRLRWDRSLVATELLESILMVAGQFAGIGSGRAIGMGRFQLKAFEVLNGS